MTWRGQVGAVVAKDLRQRWWMLALLAGVLVMAVVRMTVAQQEVTGSFGWYDTFIPILIIWITTAVVRDDPPAVSTAFWATQPLEPSALAAAKLVQGLCVCGMVLVAAAIILRECGIAWSDLPANALPTLIASATVAIGGATLATSGTGSRGPLLAVAAALFAFYGLARLVPDWVLWSKDLPSRWVWILILASTIAAFVRTYTMREAAMRWRLFGSALVALLALCALKTTEPPALALTAGVTAPVLSLSVPPAAAASSTFRVTLDGLRTAADDIRVDDAFVRIEQPDGRVLRIPVIGLGVPVDARPGPLTPSRSDARAGPELWTIRVGSAKELDGAWKLALRPGATITFEGTLAEFARKPLYRTALVPGPIAAAPPHARHTLALVTDADGTFAQFDARSFVPTNMNPLLGAGMPVYRLRFEVVNRATGTTLGEVGLSGSSGEGFGVIPGISIVDQHVKLGFAGGSRAPVTDSTWRAAHDLVVSAPTVARAYRVRASTVLGR